MQARVKQARNEVIRLRQQRELDLSARIDAACDARAQADIAELHNELRDLTGYASLQSAIENHVKLRVADARRHLIARSIFDAEHEEDWAVFERLGLSPIHLWGAHQARIIFGTGQIQSFETLRARKAKNRAARDEEYQAKLGPLRGGHDYRLVWEEEW